MNKEIKTIIKNAKNLLNKQMPKIIKSSSEFDELSNAKKKEQAEFYIRIIYKIIEDWGTQTKYLSLFKNTGLMTGEVGQFAVSFTFNAQVNRDPIIKDVAEVEQIITSTIKSMSPASMHGGGDVVNYQPSGKQWKRIQSKKYNPDNPKSHQYKRYSGQVTQDVIVEGKNGRKYSFSVKNYISEILLQGVKNVSLTIRTEKSMEAFMGDVMRSSPRMSVTQDDINRFVYVLVNNIFRGDSSSVLLNTFMNGLINFYLQNEFVKNLTHASTQLKQKFGGDVRNSFIVMSGMYLIPMSTILTSIRDNLQLALDQEYSEMSESSLLKIGDTNYKDSGYLMPNL